MSRRIEDFVLEKLSALYPGPKSELHFISPYQLCVAVILSAQCTDRKVNEISPLVFSRWPDFESLGKARFSSLSKVIRPVNYYRTKSQNLIRLSKEVINRYNGSLPADFDELLTLPGIGRKSASVILGEQKIEKTIPVDTHVFRVSRRLGLASGNTPEKVEMELRKRFKPESWYQLHHGLILHGRRICRAPRPLCLECPLLKRCPYGKLSAAGSSRGLPKTS